MDISIWSLFIMMLKFKFNFNNTISVDKKRLKKIGIGKTVDIYIM